MGFLQLRGRATKAWALLASHDGLACFTEAGSRKHPASRARPARYPGRRSTGVATDGATDAEEVDVPARDEQRIRNTHYSRITCNGRAVQETSSMRTERTLALGHMRGNRVGPASIPRVPAAYAPGHRACCRSALTDPAERRLRPGGHRSGRRLVLAVAPGATRAVLVMMLPAWNADHAPNCAA